MEHVDAIVVGAGVVGLAVTRALALAGREVLILEGEHAIGTATSSRNSGVIHAGIYYKPGSLKAKLSVEGSKRLYVYAAERGSTIEDGPGDRRECARRGAVLFSSLFRQRQMMAPGAKY